MPVEFIEARTAKARPIYLIEKDGVERSALSPDQKAWAAANGFSGQSERVLVLPGEGGSIAGALLGTGQGDGPFASLLPGCLAKKLPEGEWLFATPPSDPGQAAIGLALGAYGFNRYGAKPTPALRVEWPQGADRTKVARTVEGVYLARDLVNIPASDMGPDALETAVRTLAAKHGAEVSVVAGDELLTNNFPMIHAVGRAAAEAPRLIDLSWGAKDAPKVALVGKGVCFDTGGLDIKPASGMLLMKKDMGGAANVLGLASMIMTAKLPVRLRVLIPAVENAIAGNAFRPGDILKSRKGPTVEIGNTDAEGRLVLADALALADDDHPQILIDMATLTGAARVALGPDLPPFYTSDEGFAEELASASRAVADPVWRMPLWQPYRSNLSSRIADMNNVTTDGFAGSITAALFLQRFVEKAKTWAHFDIFAWCPVARPHCPIGGEAQAVRALDHLLASRYA